MSTFITGGRLVTEVDSYEASLLVEDGLIQAVGRDLAPPDDAEIYNVAGKLVMPGVVDVHVHVGLDLRGRRSSDFETTTREAAFGGVTTFLTYAMPAKGQTLLEAVESRLEEARGSSYVDFGAHAALVNWSEREDEEIPELIEAGVPSFKMFTVYSREGWKSGEEDLYRALLLTGRHGGLVEVHCENEWIIERKIRRLVAEGRLSALDHARSRPSYVEGEAVSNVLRVAYDAAAPVYIVHVSSGQAVEAIAEARELGVEVYAETCPHFLLLDESDLEGPLGHRKATCPPLRPPTHREALWEALEDGSIQVVATDHAEFRAADKDAGAGDFREIPMGVPGVGTLLPLMWHYGVGEGRMTENELVDRLCTEPSEIFGLQPSKGTLKAGSDADIVVFDPELRETVSPELLHGYADYSPYDGFEVRGWPVSTMVRGSWVVKDRELVGGRDHGTFVHRGPVCQRPGRRPDRVAGGAGPRDTGD
ncbi:MAG: dihydropyrimidinase [Candidatus Eisenbacteria bacterium]|nr:dihydropyrimidinase [Candidatus Eisenbacteria bacterium]